MAVVNSFARFYEANYPATSDVRLGSPTYGDSINVLNGSLDVSGDPPQYPAEADVREGVNFGPTSNPTQFTGNVHVPPPERVEENYLYDTNRSIPGELVAQELVLPDVTDVRLLVEYGDVAGGNPSIGVLQLPAEAQVLAGIGYGAYGTEFEGTLTDLPGGGGSTQPPVLGNGGLRSPLIIGDRYEVAVGRAFVWIVPTWNGFDAGAATATFEGRGAACGCNVVPEWQKAATSIVDNGDDTATVTFELTAAESAEIEAGTYSWSASLDGVTFASSSESGTVDWVCV